MTNQSGHKYKQHHLFLKKNYSVYWINRLIKSKFTLKFVGRWLPVHNPAFFTEKQKKEKEYNGNKAELKTS